MNKLIEQKQMIDRMDGLVSIEDKTVFLSALDYMARDLHDEGFELEDVMEYFYSLVNEVRK